MKNIKRDWGWDGRRGRQADKLIVGQSGGWTDGRTERQTDGRTDGQREGMNEERQTDPLIAMG